MTTYNLNTTSNVAKFLPHNDYTVSCSIPLTTAATGDVYNLPITVPAGAYVVDAFIDSDAVDTGSTVVLALGDATSTGRFISGSTSGQVGGRPSFSNQRGGVSYQYTSNTTLQLQITTGSGTYQQGNVRVGVSLNTDTRQGGG